MNNDEKLEKITEYLKSRPLQEYEPLDDDDPHGDPATRTSVYVYYRAGAPRRHVRISWELLDDMTADDIIGMLKNWNGSTGVLLTTEGMKSIDDVSVG